MTKTKDSQNEQVRCQFCNKIVSRDASLEAGHGKRCALIQYVMGKSGETIHAFKLVDSSIVDNPNYIKVAQVHRVIDERREQVGGLSVNKMVEAIGGDRMVNAKGETRKPRHAIATPIYAKTKGTRYVHKFMITITGLRAIATKDFSKVTAKATKEAEAAIDKATAE